MTMTDDTSLLSHAHDARMSPNAASSRSKPRTKSSRMTFDVIFFPLPCVVIALCFVELVFCFAYNRNMTSTRFACTGK